MLRTLSRDEIASWLDITDPFLMIDSFEEVEAGRRARAEKNLKSEDWFFTCHLPRSRVMPATLQIEGMLQTLVLLIYTAVDHGVNRSFVTNIDVKCLSAAEPGHTIRYDAELIDFRRGIAKGAVTGTSDGAVLCRGEFRYASPHLLAVPERA